jgi:hypothetical protein
VIFVFSPQLPVNDMIYKSRPPPRPPVLLVPPAMAATAAAGASAAVASLKPPSRKERRVAKFAAAAAAAAAAVPSAAVDSTSGVGREVKRRKSADLIDLCSDSEDDTKNAQAKKPKRDGPSRIAGNRSSLKDVIEIS